MLGALTALALVGLLLHLAIGSSLWLPPAEVLRQLGSGPSGRDALNDVIWQIRLPRALGCVLVGALLGLVGSAFQALFRNPLAEPYIVGVSSGAAVGGAVALTTGLGAAWFGMGMIALSFVGGIASLALVYALATRRGLVDVGTLLLAGVVLGAMLSAVLSLIILASGGDTNQVLRWLLGSMTPMYWHELLAMLVVLVLGGWALTLQTRKLNAFILGEESAQRLGVDTNRLKRMTLGAGTLMTAVAVGSVGIVGFLGLVAPHIARRLLGVDWRWSLLGSAAVGAFLMLGADLIAQRAVPDTELPVGVVTALLGAPFLIVLMRAESR